MNHFDEIETACADADLSAHLSHLLEAEFIKTEDQPVFGITRQVQERGRASLTRKQEWHFQAKVYKEFCQQECEFCGEPILISAAWDLLNSDLQTVCDSCQHDISKRA